MIKYPGWNSKRFMRGRLWWWGSYVTRQQGHVAPLNYKACKAEKAPVNTPQASGVHTIADRKKRVTRVHFVLSLYLENTVTYLTLRYGITELAWQGIKGKKKLILWLMTPFKCLLLSKWILGFWNCLFGALRLNCTFIMCCLCLTCSSVCNYSHILLCFSRYTVVRSCLY
jgi:hypothetical protein